jgi:ketosteroid isomerase-like protein
MNTPQTEDFLVAEALSAIDDLIGHFSAHRTAEYFRSFAPNASFVFHTVPERLDSREEYERLWARWESENGFQVMSCLSTDRRIQVFGDSAVFSHNVLTVATSNGTTNSTAERESIVMHRAEDRWLCVHEHLSLGVAQ